MTDKYIRDVMERTITDLKSENKKSQAEVNACHVVIRSLLRIVPVASRHLHAVGIAENLLDGMPELCGPILTKPRVL